MDFIIRNLNRNSLKSSRRDPRKPVCPSGKYQRMHRGFKAGIFGLANSLYLRNQEAVIPFFARILIKLVNFILEKFKIASGWRLISFH